MINRLRENLMSVVGGDDGLVVGVSGGVDSVVLLRCLVEECGDLVGDIVVAHVNHCLRGADADEDEKFVRDLAEGWGLEFFGEKVDVGAMKGSFEENGRKVRYDFFEKIRDERGARWIVTAHHANDSLESVLMNEARGCGLRGRQGILLVRGDLLRPFFNVKKSELLGFAAANGIEWREDKTNEDLGYLRNSVRVGVDEKMVDDFLAGQMERVDELEWRRRVADDFLSEDFFFLSDFLKLDLVGRSEVVVRLYEQKYGSTKGLSEAFVLECVEFFDGGRSVGRKDFGAEFWLVVEYGKVRLIEKEDELIGSVERRVRFDERFDWNGYEVETRVVNCFDEVRNGALGCDLGMIGEGLYCRQWENGDRFSPLGMKNGSKKLQDFFVDNKVPVMERRKMPIFVTEADKVVAVGGLQIGDEFKITEKSGQIVEIFVR